MSNGNESTNTGEQHITSFSEATRIPQQHSLIYRHAPQLAITDFINSIIEEDDISIDKIVACCWELQAVQKYMGVDDIKEITGSPTVVIKNPAEYKQQLIRMYIAQALRSYIDKVVRNSVN